MAISSGSRSPLKGKSSCVLVGPRQPRAMGAGTGSGCRACYARDRTSSPCQSFSVLMCCIFPRVERALVFCVIILLRVERALELLCYIFRMWNALWCHCVIFSTLGTHYGVIVLYFLVCGTRSGVILLYFPHVERALQLLCYIFRAWNVIWRYCLIFFSVWNALWRYCVIFSARGTCYGIIVLYFPRVEGALALLCYIFRACNALWYFVFNSFCVVIYLPCDLPVFISKLS